MTSESVGLFSGYFKNHVNISIHSFIRKSVMDWWLKVCTTAH